MKRPDLLPAFGAALLAFVPTIALAHAGHGSAGGFVAGVLHPILGPDHLLAMLAVGLWAALTGGRAILAYPVVFLGGMAAGGLMGAQGMELRLTEPLILASVIMLGAAAALCLRLPIRPVLAVVAVFGAMHGVAHGLEGPSGGAAGGYAAGLMLTTAGLHGIGIAAGLIAARAGSKVLARGLGGTVALSGVALAFV